MLTHPKLFMCSFARLHHLFVALRECVWEIGREGGRASVKRERGAHKTRYTDCVVRLKLLLHPHKHSNTANTHTRTYLDPDLISNEY